MSWNIPQKYIFSLPLVVVGYEDISRYFTTIKTNLLNENKFSFNLCDRKGKSFLVGRAFLLQTLCGVLLSWKMFSSERSDTKTCAMTMDERSETTVLLREALAACLVWSRVLLAIARSFTLMRHSEADSDYDSGDERWLFTNSTQLGRRAFSSPAPQQSPRICVIFNIISRLFRLRGTQADEKYFLRFFLH